MEDTLLTHMTPSVSRSVRASFTGGLPDVQGQYVGAGFYRFAYTATAAGTLAISISIDSAPVGTMRPQAVTAVSFPTASTSALVDNSTTRLLSPLHSVAGETVTMFVQLTDLIGVAVPAVLPVDYSSALRVHVAPAPSTPAMLYKQSGDGPPDFA